VIGRADWLDNPDFNTPEARLPASITSSPHREVDDDQDQDGGHGTILNPLNVAVRADSLDEGDCRGAALRATETVVEVDHPKRGKYLTVGNPISCDSPACVRRSPCWASTPKTSSATIVGLNDEEIRAARQQGAI